MADISNNIKNLRSLCHMSQSQLADMIGVTRQTISSWERGISYPDIEMLEKLSQIFEVGIDELLYPHLSRRKKLFVSKPLTVRFIIISIAIYFVFLIWGGGLIAVPLFRKLVGGSIGEEFIYIIYWGLILLVGYIALCAHLLSEYYVSAFSDELSINQRKTNEHAETDTGL